MTLGWERMWRGVLHTDVDRELLPLLDAELACRRQDQNYLKSLQTALLLLFFFFFYGPPKVPRCRRSKLHFRNQKILHNFKGKQKIFPWWRGLVAG
jgi:hypothetical protein